MSAVSAVGTVFSDLKSHIIEFYESESRSDKEIERLEDALKLLVEEIWENGLEPDYLDYLISIFCDTELSRDSRNIILDCLVPQTRVSSRSSEKMVLWVFRNIIPLEEDCSRVLWWLKIMIRYNLVEADSMERWYNMLLKYLLYPSLVKQLCEILFLLLKPKFVTESNSRLVEKYFEEEEDPCIGRLLWEFAQHAPHFVDKKFHLNKPLAWDKESISNFETVIKTQASRTGNVDALRTKNSSQRVSVSIPVAKYEKVRNDVHLQKIGDVKSMFELGRTLERLQLPTNEVSLLQSEEGIMHIVVNGPSIPFLSALSAELSKPNVTEKAAALIMSISGLQELLGYGLPPVTLFLSDFLTTWDGTYKEEYVYCLLPRVHFNTFSDLKERILVPLTRVYVTDSAETKVKILDSLLLLLTNMISFWSDSSVGRRWCCNIPTPKWTEDIEGTASRLVEYINQLWIHGVTLEGQECTHLVLHAVLFYQNLNTLVIKCHFPLFWVIHPSLSHPALLSKNHVILDELCTLILSYKKQIIPIFEKVGLLDEFESQVETVMALADSTFKYLWESVGGERPENFHTTSDEFTPTSSIGLKHLALYPIVCTLSTQLKRDTDSMTKSELMTLLSTFMKGVAEFIKHEEHEQLT